MHLAQGQIIIVFPPGLYMHFYALTAPQPQMWFYFSHLVNSHFPHEIPLVGDSGSSGREGGSHLENSIFICLCSCQKASPVSVSGLSLLPELWEAMASGSAGETLRAQGTPCSCLTVPSWACPGGTLPSHESVPNLQGTFPGASDWGSLFEVNSFPRSFPPPWLLSPDWQSHPSSHLNLS